MRRGGVHGLGYTADEAWRVAVRVTKSHAVCDLAGGGYAVPVERSTEIKPPSRTVPIRARIPSGEVHILPGEFGQWQIVKPRRAARAQKAGGVMRKAIEDNRDTLKLIKGVCEDGGGQSLIVEFVGPTEADMNPRWRAKSSGGLSLTVYQDDRHGPRENAIRAAVLLCERLEWNPLELVMGGVPNGGYVFTFAPKRRKKGAR